MCPVSQIFKKKRERDKKFWIFAVVSENIIKFTIRAHFCRLGNQNKNVILEQIILARKCIFYVIVMYCYTSVKHDCGTFEQ